MDVLHTRQPGSLDSTHGCLYVRIAPWIVPDTNYLLLAGTFRLLTDELHKELADRGHFELRPVHGFALQAIGIDGATTVDIARRLDVSKQAAGKTVATLEQLRYITRSPMPGDARASLISLTPWGLRALNDSAEVLDQLRQKWVTTLGSERVAAVEAALEEMVGDAGGVRLSDFPGWLR